MSSKIVGASNDLPESQRVLRTAIELVHVRDAELVIFSAFVIVVDPTAPDAMKEDQRRAQDELHEKASPLAHEHGVRTKGGHSTHRFGVPVCPHAARIAAPQGVSNWWTDLSVFRRPLPSGTYFTIAVRLACEFALSSENWHNFEHFCLFCKERHLLVAHYATLAGRTSIELLWMIIPYDFWRKVVS